jgi:crotonobetainyl-CoA:carnitine CoA-transferase CaiB-like acyl-CoA transferase
VPAGEVNDIAGAFALADRLGLEPIVEVPRADGSTVRTVRNPITLSATPVSYESAPPALGEASSAVLDLMRAAPSALSPGP